MSGFFLKLLNMSIFANRGCGAGTLSAEEIAEVDSLYLVGAGWNPAAVPVSIRDDI